VPKVHIVEYRCELCGATATAEAGERSHGICETCSWPMTIEDLFTDRRFVTLPVNEDRRDEQAA
jgi:rubredoxin